jgi:hypothetical protein
MLRSTRVTVCAVALAVPSAAWAHGSYVHVLGTVIAADDRHVELKTDAKASVTVLLTKDTKYLRKGAPVGRDELKVGARVLIDASKKGEELEAKELRIVPAPSASPGGPR